MIGRHKKTKRVGKVEEKRRYDLPLSQDSSSRFLLLLITLMSFLTILALSAVFFLTTLTNHWVGGLENTMTIEIPAILEGRNNDNQVTQALRISTKNKIVKTAT